MELGMRVGIVGCGRIGRKRAQSLPDTCTPALFCDIRQEQARSLALQFHGSEACSDWREAVRRPDLDIIVVSTTHDQLAVVAAEAAASGKHVLVEKPCARRASELEPVLQAIAATGVRVRAGFNHRYHRALQKAREIFETGVLGDLMFIRGRYGHGGRPGYDQEWRADPEVSGGGEAIDQG
ncbi:MAG: Gfo/Idh/MocA family protein, partial [Bryobacteraceae bacterium]